jgi:DNA-binding PadR family transcriptional regulator
MHSWEVLGLVATRLSNPLALAVLVLLAEQPMHPYQMSATLKERRKEDSIKINYGSLYSVVESLHKRGLIETRETLREGNRPERTIYGITHEGTKVMREWLSELLSTPVKEYPRFEAALSLMPALPPAEVITLLEQRLERQRATFEHGRGQMDGAKFAGMPRLFAIEHEYELAVLNAEVEFLVALLDDLKAGDFSGLGGWRLLHELLAKGRPYDEIWVAIKKEFPEDYAWIDAIE